jgi:tetratricopeptide (TPR) repeat protein
MKNDEAIWYLCPESETIGPYTEEEIAKAIREWNYRKTTKCWRDEKEGWQPLKAFEPFRKAFAYRLWKSIRIAAVVGLMVCLVAGGVAAYFVLMGPAAVREGRKLIDGRLYVEAAKVLAPYVERKPLDNKGRYLLAIARVNQYATGDTGESIAANLSSLLETGGSMEAVQKDLRRVLDAEPELKETARSDLTAAAGQVPSSAVDAPVRALTIARLRAELALANKTELADNLLTRVASPGKEGDRAILRNHEVVLQIYDWDASLGKRIVELAIVAGSGPKQPFLTVVETLGQWVSQRPALAGEAVSQLLKMGQALYEAGRTAEAKVVLSKVLEIDPKAVKTREQILLCVPLMDPGNPKLLLCRLFWATYPNDPALPEVLLAIVKDTVAVFGRYGGGTQKYMEAGLAAATTLVQERPKTAELDVHVYELTKRLAQDRQFDKAVPLAKALLAAVPNSALKGQIEASIDEWERQAPGPDPADPDLAIVKNAVAYFDRAGTWDNPTGQRWMRDGLSAANRLLEKRPKTAGFDTAVFELAKRLAQGKRCQETLDLAGRLLVVVPGSALRQQIETSINQWRIDCQPPGNSPVRIVDPTELQKILGGGVKGDLLWVAVSKAAAGVGNTKKLLEWTRAGGVLWVETDLAEAFGLGNVIAIPSQRWQGDAQVPSVPSIQYPTVKALQGKAIGYEIFNSGGVIADSLQDVLSKMMPLLVQSQQAQQGRRPITIMQVFCGVRRYGNGFVVFRPMKIDTTSDAGRRLEAWLRSPGS